MWLITLTLGSVIIALWLSWRKNKIRYFEELNIPSPPASVLFGNYWELMHEGQHNCIERWIKEYGRVFGYYYGMRPVLVVADLDMLKQIQQKDFHKFSSRPKLFEVGSSSRKYNDHSITTVDGKRWKDLRSVMTPTFTTAKLKMMSNIVDTAVDELVEAVDREASHGKSFDIYTLYQNLTMDVIARTSLGVHSKAQLDKNEPFVKLARVIFSFRFSLLVLLTFSFTEFTPIFSFIRRIRLRMMNDGTNPRGDLQKKVQAAIRARRNDPSCRRPDVLQLMMDAQRSEEAVNDKNLTAGENEEVVSNGTPKVSSSKNAQGLTDLEIEQNATVFLLAGFETTSTALAFLTHCLAYNQDVQDRIREEINENISDDAKFSYEAVNNLQYLDRVLNEALRMYPPITYFVNRQLAEDTIINGIHLPKDIAIQVPVHFLHHDPTIWEDPETFNPDRFSPEEKKNRHPMAFQAFGAGPRNCIGMRFAQMEAKMAIAKLIRKYKLLPKSGTRKEDFKVCNTVVTMRPDNGVVVQMEKI